MSRKKYETDEERLEAKRAAWRRWASRNDRTEYLKQYDQNRPNRVERNEQMKARRAANPEKYSKIQRESYERTKNNDRPSNKKEYKLWWNARKRATSKGLPFDLERSDVVIPAECPCCKTAMYRPSLDQINPNQGYTKKNVAVICLECNVIKSFGTAKRHRQIADWMDEQMID